MSRDADRRHAALRLAVLGLAIAAAFVAVTAAGITPAAAQRWVDGAGLAGPVVFVVVGGLLGLALFPGHVTATVAGMLFGVVGGTLLMLAATLIGAGACLVVAGRLGADAVLSLLGPRGRQWRDWLSANGFNAVLASRLAPGVPAGIVNYVAGLAGIRPARVPCRRRARHAAEDDRVRRARRCLVGPGVRARWTCPRVVRVRRRGWRARRAPAHPLRAGAARTTWVRRSGRGRREATASGERHD